MLCTSGQFLETGVPEWDHAVQYYYYYYYYYYYTGGLHHTASSNKDFWKIFLPTEMQNLQS